MGSTHQRFLDELPPEWSTERIEQLGDVVGGSTPSRAVDRFWGGDIPWVTPGELTALRTKYLEGTRERITQAGLNSCGARLLPANVLLVTSRATLGAVALSLAPMSTNQGFKSVIFRDEAEPSFFFHLFHRVGSELQRRASGTTFLEVSAREFKAIRLPVPPLPEQRQIAEILDTLDEAIRKTEETIAKLKQVKQGLLHDLLTRGIDDNGELRDPDRHPEQFKDSPLGAIPKGWKIGELGSLSPRLAGRLIVQPHQYFSGRGVPIVFGSNIRPGWIDTSGIKRISHQADEQFAHCRLRAGDLLTVRVGIPGMTAVVSKELDGCHFASTMWIQQSRSFDSYWLCFVMNSVIIRRQIESANYGSVQTQFNIGEAAHFLLPVPPQTEQRHIVKRLRAFEERSRAEDETLAKFRVLKRGLLEDLLTGRVRVTKVSEDAA